MTDPVDTPGTEANAEKPGKRNWADLTPRLWSALVLIAAVIGSLVLGGYVFAIVVGVVFAGIYREWDTMVTQAPLTPLSWCLMAAIAVGGSVFPAFGAGGSAIVVGLAAIVAAIFGGQARIWRPVGILFIGAVAIALLALRGNDTTGLIAGVFLGTTVWLTDSGAFFAGRQIGGEKLAPDISPSKTWSGALGGLAIGTIGGTIVWAIFTSSPLWLGIVLAMTLSLLGQAGDLTESALKRHFRIKDSGDIIPGHGGLMDRLDSISFGTLFLVIVGTAHAGFDAVAHGLLYW